MSQGRGRGRNKNLPAWITNNKKYHKSSSSSSSSSHFTSANSAAVPGGSSKEQDTTTITTINSLDLQDVMKKRLHDNHEDDNNHKDADLAFAVSAAAAAVAFEKEEEEELKRLEALLSSDNAAEPNNIDEEEENMARKRREARKRRLQQLASQEEQVTNSVIGGGGGGSSSSTSSDKKRRSNLPGEASSNEEEPKGEQYPSNNHNHHHDNNNYQHQHAYNGHDVAVPPPPDGNDSFDIFSSSVSPPTPATKKQGNVPKYDTAMKNGKAGAIIAPGTTKNATTMIASSGMDDAEGYYRATIGEMIRFSSDPKENESTLPCCFRVSGIIGKGVFSTVLKCVCIMDGNGSINNGVSSSMMDAGGLDNDAQQLVVAIKLIRSNETMAKAAQKEVRILRLLHANSSATATTATTTTITTTTTTINHHVKRNQGSSRAKYIVKLLEIEDFKRNSMSNLSTNTSFTSSLSSTTQPPLLEYHNHTALLFEYMPFNLRETLSKFGKNVGINLTAVRSYAKQLLTALQHLEDHRVVHADIKLDNILVSSDFSTVKLCDFGSAFFETDTDNDPTPYLVSRFYRAPEIILGMEYDKKIDLWSVAVSLAELFTGRVLFPGMNNNDMLRRFMESIGPFSNKMIRRHIISFQQMGLDPHFEASVVGGSHFNFKRQELDKVSGKPVIRVVSASSVTVPSKQVTPVLLRCRSASDGRTDVILFGEFLGRCLALDPQKRPIIDDMLSHGFFTGGEKKNMVDKVVARGSNSAS